MKRKMMILKKGILLTMVTLFSLGVDLQTYLRHKVKRHF